MISKPPDGFVRRKLATDSKTGFYAEIQEIPAGSIFSEHRHTGLEWVYVIEGKLEDEFGEYPAGTFKINEKDSVHAPRSRGGCKLIVFRNGDYAPTKD